MWKIFLAILFFAITTPAFAQPTSPTFAISVSDDTTVVYTPYTIGFSGATVTNNPAGAALVTITGGSGVTSVTGTAPVVSSGGTTPAISMAAATTAVNGYLSSTDWTTFNNKQAGPLTGDVTTSGAAATIAVNSVALSTDTTGNYALGDAEGGAATTGDSATAFFSSGTLEVAIGGTGTTTSTGTGAVVLGTSPTIATPALTLQDGNGSAPTTDGVIKYDRTAEVFQVGDGTITRSFPSSKVIAGFSITNGNTAIDATVTDPVACQRINNNSTITGWYIDCDASGSIVLDVWKNTWDDTPEVNGDSIAGTEKPTLSTDVSASDTALGSMTTDWNAGQNVCIEIESAATVTKCSVTFAGYND